MKSSTLTRGGVPPRKTRRFAATLMLALTALVAVQEAQAGPAWAINQPTGFRNSSWSFGDVFTVGGSNVSVTALGAFDDQSDGFVTRGGIQVGIYRESDGALLQSTSVLSTDGLTANYRYHGIAPLTLMANTIYRVVAVNGDDLYNISTSTPNNVDPMITWNRYGYCNTGTLTRCDSLTGTERTWMANFMMETSQSVPEPGTFALLAGALMLLGAARRRS